MTLSSTVSVAKPYVITTVKIPAVKYLRSIDGEMLISNTYFVITENLNSSITVYDKFYKFIFLSKFLAFKI